MIQIEREKLEKVLGALEDNDSLHGDTTQQAITIIKDVFAQPDQFRDATKMMAQKNSEPVAWWNQSKDSVSTDPVHRHNSDCQPLYTKEQL